jgi:Flp pilus assembly protein TadB
MFSVLYALLFLVVGAGIYSLMLRILSRQRELRRFRATRIRWWEFLVDDARKFLRYRIEQRRRSREMTHQSELRQLIQAGLESVEVREKYYLAKDVSVLVTIIVCIAAFQFYSETIAVILTVASIALGFWGPRVWVALRAKERQAQYERELPFLLYAIAYGTDVGWDVMKVLNRLANTYGEMQPSLPLAREVKRGQWRAITGGKWSESFREMPERFPSVAVAHTIAALGDALEADVQTHELLAGVARDAHRNYLVRLEGKLAILPVMTITIGCMLLLGFALLLQLPFL